MDTQRVRLTLLAAFLFTFAFFFFTQKRQPVAPVDPSSQSTTPALNSTTSPTSGTNAGTTGANGGAGDGAVPAGKYDLTDVPDADIAPLENDKIRVELEARGGTIRQIWLKEFFRNAEARAKGANDPSGWETLIREGIDVDAVPSLLAMAEHGSPPAESLALATRPWAVREDQDRDGLRRVIFTYHTAAGIELEKQLVLRRGSNAVDVTFVTRKLDPALPNAKIFRVRVGGGMIDTMRGQMSNAPEAVAMVEDEHGSPTVHRHHASDLAEKPQSYEKPTNGILAWGGVANHYFALLLAPADSTADQKTVTILLGAANAKDEQSVTSEVAIALPLDAEGTTETRFRLYAGPKDPKLLVAQDLPRLVPFVEEDYGSTFRWINKALLDGLRFFHDLVGNWGFAIMLLTLLVRAMVFPITRAQQVSMAKYAAKMAVLKPKLDRLKAEIGDNPQKFAQEQMKLLREYKATPPLFGCLSSFITLPVFVGMWQILRSAIELRQAPFCLWIHDLSLADRLFTIPGINIAVNVLPILATGAFILQIAIQPKPTDPQAAQQQKIMMIMPLVFGVIFYNYAAGLSLYSLTSSGLSIFETKVIKKKWPVPTPGAAVIPAQVVKKK